MLTENFKTDTHHTDPSGTGCHGKGAEVLRNQLSRVMPSCHRSTYGAGRLLLQAGSMSDSRHLKCIGHIRPRVTAPIEDVDVEGSDVAHLEIDCRILKVWAGADVVINAISGKRSRRIPRLTTRIQPRSVCIYDFNNGIQRIVDVLTLSNGRHMHRSSGQGSEFVVIIVSDSRNTVR